MTTSDETRRDETHFPPGIEGGVLVGVSQSYQKERGKAPPPHLEKPNTTVLNTWYTYVLYVPGLRGGAITKQRMLRFSRGFVMWCADAMTPCCFEARLGFCPSLPRRATTLLYMRARPRSCVLNGVVDIVSHVRKVFSSRECHNERFGVVDIWAPTYTHANSGTRVTISSGVSRGGQRGVSAAGRLRHVRLRPSSFPKTEHKSAAGVCVCVYALKMLILFVPRENTRARFCWLRIAAAFATTQVATGGFIWLSH